MSMLRFLLLENKLPDIEAIQAVLSAGNLGYELLTVGTRAAFIEALETQTFDLILAAYALPGFDGIAALKTACKHCPDVPFIFVSASLGEELAIETLKQGATDYVLKQRLVRLLPCVQRALREARERRERKQAELMLVEQKRLLELIAAGQPLETCLAAVCGSVAQLSPRTRASFLLADAQRQTFPRSITPGLPPSFGQGLKDVPINDLYIGTCGEAVYHGQCITCADVANDDRWSQGWRDLWLAHGILSCHSTPVIGADGLPLGALMLAFDEARLPTDWEYQLANFGTQIASIAFERDRAHAALRESEAKYRTLFESIDEGFCIVEVLFEADGRAIDHRILQANAAFGRHTGILNPKGKTASELAPGIEQYWNDLYAQVIQTGETVRLENRSDALDRWFNLLVWRVGDASTSQVATVFTDITERKRAEMWLQASHDTFRHLVKTSPFGVYTVDADFRLAQVSAGAQKVFANIHPLIGRDFAEILHVLWPELFASETIARFRHTLETGEPYHSPSTIERRHDINTVESYDWKLERIMLPDGRFGVVCHFYDLSERQHYEAALRESEAQNRNILESISDAFFAVDANWRFIYVNQTAGTLVNRTSSDLLGKVFWEEFPAVNDSAFEQMHRRVMRDRVAESLIEFYPDHDRWYEVRSYPAVNGITMYFTNVTDQIQVEAVLRESEEKTRNVLESIAEAFFALDHDWRFTYINQSGGVLLDRQPGDLIGKGFWEEYPGLSGSEFETVYRRTMQDRLPGTLTAFYPDHGRWYDIRTYPAANGITVYFNNVTEQIQVGEALRDSEERFRTLADQMSQFAWMADANGWIFWYNQRWFEYTGTTLEAMQGWGWQQVHHPEHLDRVVEHFRHCLEAGEPWEDTFPLRSRDGTYRWFLSRATPIRDEQGQILRWFGTNTDITERLQAEQEREQLLEQEQAAREEAERANRLKDEFLAVLSHELRSPLNPILGWSRLLQNGTLDESRQAEALQTIERNAKLQAQLIEDLLDISRIMQGKLSLTATPVSLAFVITAAVETVRLAAEAKNIQILLDLTTAIAPVSGDVARLQQVMWNLLTNAVKFTPNDGHVTVELRQLDQLAQIRVIDTGKGIQSQFLPHVFEYFRQEDGSTTRKFGGLGLGLAIVRQIVEMHGGTVAVESQGEHQGATFIVQLPVMQRAIPIRSTTTRPSNAIAAPLGKMQILLVDDAVDTREYQAFLLQQNGATVTAVASGLEALHALEQVAPDIIVSDIGMADMDGYTLIQQIRSRPANQSGSIPAIALTAYATELDQQKVLQAGFQAHITKPVEPDVLVRAIVQLLGHK